MEWSGGGGAGYCISFIEQLFSYVRQLDLPQFLHHPELIVSVVFLLVTIYCMLLTSHEDRCYIKGCEMVQRTETSKLTHLQYLLLRHKAFLKVLQMFQCLT